MKAIKRLLPVGNCDTSDPYEVIENIQKRAEIKREERHLAETVRKEKHLAIYRECLKPGRLFVHKNKNVYVVFRTSVEKGNLVCAAHNLRKTVRVRKGDVRLRRVEPHHIKSILDYRVDLPMEMSPERLQSLFSSIPLEKLNPLPVDLMEREPSAGLSGTWPHDRPKLACEGCEHIKICHNGKKSEIRKLLSEFRYLAGQMEGMGEGLWLSFKRHLRFLKETRFVDERDRLTPDGVWASKLRLDHPLLIAEAIREGGFDEVTLETMAGCLAPFVWDRVQDLETKVRSPMGLGAMEQAFQRLLGSLEQMRALLARRGFANPQIPFWPAAALFLWAKGMDWQKLLFAVPGDEGDMAALIVRTADHLRQVANLEETHPELASRAKQAIRLILREPVHIE
jgi:hypothetical protein